MPQIKEGPGQEFPFVEGWLSETQPFFKVSEFSISAFLRDPSSTVPEKASLVATAELWLSSQHSKIFTCFLLWGHKGQIEKRVK